MTQQKPIVLVIGDIMLDVRTEGEMSSISLEAPVPVIRQTGVTESLGGAGNVARNIKALGHDVLLMGLVGNDAAGAKVIKLASESGIPACLPSWEYPTIVKHRITSGGQIVARVDTEATVTITPAASVAALINGLVSMHPAQLAAVRLIVVADYGKGTMTEELMTRGVRQLAATYNIPIFVDARPQTMSLYHGVALLKPNLREAMRMCSDIVHPGLAESVDPDTRCGVACRFVREKYGASVVVVTDGGRGCHYNDPDDQNKIHVCEPLGLKGVVRDVCGAGDTTMAALAVGSLEGLSVSLAAQFAMDAASYVVQFYGVQAAERDRVDELIYTHGGWARKLMNPAMLSEFIARRRRLFPDQQIVLTNGCFDGFHAGHLETLRFASRCGACVVVAYNDDQSLIALKGPGRPHVPDSYRGSHLAMQECVAAVVRFDGDVDRLVRSVRPDVLVKGADSGPVSRIPGADFMATHGGRVELCPMSGFTITVDRSATAGKVA